MNIRNNDPVFRGVTSRIMKYIPEQYLDLMMYLEGLDEKVRIIAGDNYFLHYSVVPVLRVDDNPDDLLNKVLQFLRNYMSSDEYKSVRNLTMLDDELSLLHTVELTKEILKHLLHQVDDRLMSIKRSQGNLAGNTNELVRMALSDVLSDDEALKRILKSAISSARDVAEGYSHIKQLTGGRLAGKEVGEFNELLDLSKVLIRDVRALQIITTSLKIIQSLPNTSRIIKVRDAHGDEIMGYRLTKDLSKALPREMALPDELFYYKLLTSGFISRERVTTSEGAYYVLVDVSGSMDGIKTIWSRSVALALFRLANMRGRKYFLNLFNIHVYPKDPVSDPLKIVKLLTRVESGGGTSIDTALDTALQNLKNTKLGQLTNTVIIITDGEDTVHISRNRFKEVNASLVAVMVDGSNDTLRDLAVSTGGQYLKVEPDVDGALRIVDLLRKR